MDLLTLIITIILILFAVQASQIWVAVGILFIIILSTRDMKISLLLVLALVLFVMFGGSQYLTIILFGLVVIAILLGLKPGDEGGGGYSSDLGGLGGLLGGGH